jgi:molybdate transport system substrate-binding protein
MTVPAVSASPRRHHSSHKSRLAPIPTSLAAAALALAACAAPTDSFEIPTTAALSGTPAAPTEGVDRELTVFAAASLTDAFGRIADAFEAAHPGVTVAFNFAGSQALRTQIEEARRRMSLPRPTSPNSRR